MEYKIIQLINAPEGWNLLWAASLEIKHEEGDALYYREPIIAWGLAQNDESKFSYLVPITPQNIAGSTNIDHGWEAPNGKVHDLDQEYENADEWYNTWKSRQTKKSHA